MKRKLSSRKFETQEELIREAKRLSALVFSEGENHKEVYLPKFKPNYFYFPAISYFENESITPEMIKKLQSRGNLLSVGSGDGHLERLITEGFNVSKKRIVLSDIELDPGLEKRNFRTCEFDMTKPWPDFQEKFDYIFFPQSLGVAVMHIGGDQNTRRFFDFIGGDTERILKGENPRYPDFFRDVIEMDIPVVNLKYNIFKEALLHLKPDGEIRVNYGIGEKQQRAYVILRLKEENQKISFPRPNEGHNFTIKLNK